MTEATQLQPFLAALGKQIRLARKARSLGTEALALQTGMAAQNVRAIEAGQRNVTVATRLRLANALEVPVAALLPDQDAAPRQRPPLPQLAGLRALGWQVAQYPSRPAGQGWIPALDAAVQAGPVADWKEAEVLGWALPPVSFRSPDGLFALRVWGDSMLPKVADGEWVLCRAPASAPLLGKMLVVGHEAGERGWQLKRLAALQVGDDDAVVATLASLNRAFPPLHLTVREETELLVAAEWLCTLRPGDFAGHAPDDRSAARP